MIDSFQVMFGVDLKKSLDSSDNEDRYIFGLASTEDFDMEGEKMLQKGLNIDYFKNYGFYNYDHWKGPDAIIGVPIPEYLTITNEGFQVAGRLYKGTKLADETWNLIKVLHKSQSNRSLSFSVEGVIVERDPVNPKIVTKAMITEVAVTPRPINPKATLKTLLKSFKGEVDEEEELRKALEAGYEVNPTAMSGGETLRKESIGKIVSAIRFAIDNGDQCLTYLTKKGFLNREEAVLAFMLTNQDVKKLIDVYKN